MVLLAKKIHKLYTVTFKINKKKNRDPETLSLLFFHYTNLYFIAAYHAAIFKIYHHHQLLSISHWLASSIDRDSSGTQKIQNRQTSNNNARIRRSKGQKLRIMLQYRHFFLI